MSLAYAAAFIPALLISSGLACFLTPGQRPGPALMLAKTSATLALGAALVLAASLVLHGPQSLHLLDSDMARFTMRIDIVSVSMAMLVTFIGWVVVRYAATYLDGEHRQGAFTAWLLLTLGAVTLLVLAGDLLQLVCAWIATSLFLHRLLLFYADRANAQRAARKKFIVARLGDVALICAALLMARAFGTGDISTILDAAREARGGAEAAWAASFLALAAILKSAQFPAHGWLTEVMETPTPVSALLHAGVINAGGFLLIRFADVLLLSRATLDALIVVGGFTALFGSVVMLTQPAVKTSLAWSTIAQMGFMVLEAGLALFPAALLHIVVHSLYKAHAFLSSGGAVERVTAARRLGTIAVPNAGAVTRAFLSALTIFVLVGFAFGFLNKPPQAVALGAILILGVAYLLAQGFADQAPRALTLRTTLYALTASVSYFALQAAIGWITAATLPPPRPPGPLEWALICVSVASFSMVAVLQSLLPLWANHPAVAGLRVHISNGFYLNAVFDRLVGGWNVRKRI